MDLRDYFVDFITSRIPIAPSFTKDVYKDMKMLSWFEDSYDINCMMLLGFGKDDKFVELLIRRQLQIDNNKDLFSILKQLNQFSAEYTMTSFFYEEGGVVLKTGMIPIGEDKNQDALTIFNLIKSAILCACETIVVVKPE